MLSSCWLTSPFSGCFNTAIRGAVGGGGHESSETNIGRARMSQPPVSTEKSLANGSAGGLPPAGLSSSGGGRESHGGVTTVPPKSSILQDSHPYPSSGDHHHEKVVQETHSQQAPQTPRKSKSMGRIHGIGGGGGATDGGTDGGGLPPSNKEEGLPLPLPPPALRGHRRVPSDGVAWRHSKAMESEMEGDDKYLKRTYKSEYRKKFRPFSQYQYVDGKFHKAKTESDTGNAWYKEVLELRRQAGQYRARHDMGDVWKTVQCRGWGVETASDRMAEIYNKQVELWEQVSRRSSLQALSLASATPSSRPISKAEKEIENSRRSSPIKHVRDRPSTAPAKPKLAPVHKPAADKVDGKPSKETTPRHHYEKTTGSGDGHFITSPSRDKIEPTLNSDWATRRSPRKTPPVTSPVKDGITKRRPPRAISLARTSTAKDTKPSTNTKLSSAALGKTVPPLQTTNTTTTPATTAHKKTDGGRSVSAGPENRSPKRSARLPSAAHPPAPSAKAERRPRPTSLSTSSRRKGADSTVSHHEAKKPTKKSHDISASPKRSADLKSRDDKRQSSEEDAKKDKDKDEKDAKDILKESRRDSSGRKSTPEPRFDPEKYEPVVKTPPEPTRVKSPDQVMVKSPDPVNWTVPLDTGKTFTVTHNIPEGETSRGTPSSEHRPPLESRSRQTPEPTRVYQGSLAGTPITTAGTSSAVPSATTSTGTTSSVSQLPQKSEPGPVAKTSAPTVTSAPVTTSVPATASAISSAAPTISATATTTAPVPSTSTTAASVSAPSVPATAPPATSAPVPSGTATSTEATVAPTSSAPPVSAPAKSAPSISETSTSAPAVPLSVTSASVTSTASMSASPMTSSILPQSTTVSSSISADENSKDVKTKEDISKEPISDIKPLIKDDKEDIKTGILSDISSTNTASKPLDSKSTKSIQDISSNLEGSKPYQEMPKSSFEVVDSKPSSISSVGLSSGLAADPMTMSVFGSINGMNGKSSGSPSPTKPEIPSPDRLKGTSEAQPLGPRNVPGTNLKCLDDPNFLNDKSPAPSLQKVSPQGYKVLDAPSEPVVHTKPGNYRVLEAPEPSSDKKKEISDHSPTQLPEVPAKPSPYRVLEAPVEPPSRPKGSPYRVLEAPDAPPFSQPIQPVGSAQDSKPPALVSPSSGRTVTDALDKARTRFDSFWGGSKDKDPPSKV